jgi:hypothetical protein
LQTTVNSGGFLYLKKKKKTTIENISEITSHGTLATLHHPFSFSFFLPLLGQNEDKEKKKKNYREYPASLRSNKWQAVSFRPKTCTTKNS